MEKEIVFCEILIEKSKYEIEKKGYKGNSKERTQLNAYPSMGI